MTELDRLRAWWREVVALPHPPPPSTRSPRRPRPWWQQLSPRDRAAVALLTAGELVAAVAVLLWAVTR